MWVSSELQYSDGRTKASAAQLLADRLRSHLKRLKSDEDFVASKKKTAAERKKGAEKYVIRKPRRGQQQQLCLQRFALLRHKRCPTRLTRPTTRR